MKNNLLIRQRSITGPERTTLGELVQEAAAGTSTFAYVYPPVAGRVDESGLCAKLSALWSVRGFMVAVCSSTKTAIRHIREGEAWIVWDNQEARAMRVLVMRADMCPSQ